MIRVKNFLHPLNCFTSFFEFKIKQEEFNPKITSSPTDFEIFKTKMRSSFGIQKTDASYTPRIHHKPSLPPPSKVQKVEGGFIVNSWDTTKYFLHESETIIALKCTPLITRAANFIIISEFQNACPDLDP